MNTELDDGTELELSLASHLLRVKSAFSVTSSIVKDLKTYYVLILFIHSYYKTSSDL